MQKLAVGLEGTLEEPLRAANWVYYNQDQEENKQTNKQTEKEALKKKKSEALVWPCVLCQTGLPEVPAPNAIYMAFQSTKMRMSSEGTTKMKTP